MRKKLLVLDLDQTIIDSSIRENLCYPDGKLCLHTYKNIKQCPDMGIVNDTLLPFGEWVKSHYITLANMYHVVFLTAREITAHDLSSFDTLGLTSIFTDFRVRFIARQDVIHYNGNPQQQHSGLYKRDVIRTLKTRGNYDKVIIIDDCIKVLEMAQDNGYITVCARELYHYGENDFVKLFNSL